MTLELTIEEYKLINKALLKLPAEEVLELILKLNKQIIEQGDKKGAN